MWKIIGGETNNKIILKDKKTNSQQIPQLQKSLNKPSLQYKPLLTVFSILLSLYYCITRVNTIQYTISYQVVIFVRIWCLIQALGVILNANTQINFYNWFYKSEMSESQRRGLSTKGYPLFGFIKIPKLTPNQFKILVFTYAFSLCLTIFTPQEKMGYLLVCVLIQAILYFSQIWAERSASYHRECITITVLFYMVMNPNFYLSDISNSEQISAYIILFLKIHIVTIYLASNIQKTFFSIYQKGLWSNWTAHTCVWLGMWSKPFFPKIQKFAFMNPYFTAISAFGVLVWQGSFLIQFWMPFEINVILALGFLCFHTNVFLMQGIDYVTFWTPVLVLWGINISLPEINLYVLVQENPEILFSLCFIGFQILYSMSFLEDFNINIPPFTCTPMFVYVSKIFQELPQFYVLQDPKQSINYENLEWMQPYFKTEFGLGVFEEDYSKLPFRFIGFGGYQNVNKLHKLKQKWFTSELLQGKDGFFMYANFDVRQDLIEKLKELVDFMQNDERANFSYDKNVLKQLYKINQECQDMFLQNLELDDKIQKNKKSLQ